MFTACYYMFTTFYLMLYFLRLFCLILFTTFYYVFGKVRESPREFEKVRESERSRRFEKVIESWRELEKV